MTRLKGTSINSIKTRGQGALYMNGARKSAVYTESVASRPRILSAPCYIRATPPSWLQRIYRSALKWLAGLATLCLGLPVSADDAFHFNAAITVQQPAVFVQLPLPVNAYGHSLQNGLQDLRIIDARGERVPFAVLTPRTGYSQTTEQQRDAALYALPAKPSAGGVWPSPVEIIVEDERIRVKRLSNATASTNTTHSTGRSAGWLFDLGERTPQDSPPQLLRLLWSGPSEFNTSFDYEMSDDLRTWRSGGSGQLMALMSASGPLTQPSIMLPANAGRFIRLVWVGADTAPTLIGAKVISAQQRSVAQDTPKDLAISPSPQPKGKIPLDEISKRALHFDLEGALPIVQINLQLASGTTHVVPVRLQGRTHVDEPWRDLTHSVFYRLERGTVVSISPPVPLQTTVRYIRVIADERAARLDATQTRLMVQAQLASLIFAMQGQAPYTLLAGSVNAVSSALPATTLIPELETERARFGLATLGEWHVVTAVVRQAEAEKRQAELRPWVLWIVLLAGVTGLGFMVWRLARGSVT